MPAQILLKADATFANWTYERVADAFGCRTKTVENIHKRLVEQGFEVTLNGTKRQSAPTPKKVDGEQEAQVIAMRLGKAPIGYANWS